MEGRTARIDQQNGTAAPWSSRFDHRAQGIENDGKRTSSRHHFEDAFLTGEQGFGALPLIELAVRDVPRPTDDRSRALAEGTALHEEPAVCAIGASHPRFDRPRLAGRLKRTEIVEDGRQIRAAYRGLPART
jgi:hypothetical protein